MRVGLYFTIYVYEFLEEEKKNSKKIRQESYDLSFFETWDCSWNIFS